VNLPSLTPLYRDQAGPAAARSRPLSATVMRRPRVRESEHSASDDVARRGRERPRMDGCPAKGAVSYRLAQVVWSMKSLQTVMFWARQDPRP